MKKMLKRDIRTYDLREKLIFHHFHDGLVKKIIILLINFMIEQTRQEFRRRVKKQDECGRRKRKNENLDYFPLICRLSLIFQ